MVHSALNIAETKRFHMQSFWLLHTFPPAAIDVTAMDAEHVVDADEEERVARGGGGNRAGGYRHQGKGKGDKVETNMRCDYCNHMIESKPYRIYSLGNGIGMHLNCAYYYWDSYNIGDINIPVFDIPVYSEVVLASMHPDREPASSELDQASSSSEWESHTQQDRDLIVERMIRNQMIEEINKGYKAGRGKTKKERKLRALRRARCGKFCKQTSRIADLGRRCGSEPVGTAVPRVCVEQERRPRSAARWAG